MISYSVGTVSHFHPGLMLAGKAGAYPSRLPSRLHFKGGSDKHSSGNNYDRKKFYYTGPL
jgi:hypothetical protein